MFGTALAARVARCWQLSWVPNNLDLSSCFMFQCDSHDRCCACTAAVLKWYGLVVQSLRGGGGGYRHFVTAPPPGRGGPSRHWGGGENGGGLAQSLGGWLC